MTRLGGSSYHAQDIASVYLHPFNHPELQAQPYARFHATIDGLFVPMPECG